MNKNNYQKRIPNLKKKYIKYTIHRKSFSKKIHKEYRTPKKGVFNGLRMIKHPLHLHFISSLIKSVLEEVLNLHFDKTELAVLLNS